MKIEQYSELPQEIINLGFSNKNLSQFQHYLYQINFPFVVTFSESESQDVSEFAIENMADYWVNYIKIFGKDFKYDNLVVFKIKNEDINPLSRGCKFFILFKSKEYLLKVLKLRIFS